MTGRVGKAYRLLKRKFPFEFDGFSVTTVLGFIPFPAPQFKRTRPKAKVRHRKTRKQIPQPPVDPFTDTLENLRQDAIEEGEYGTAFGAALARNWYEQNKMGVSQ